MNIKVIFFWSETQLEKNQLCLGYKKKQYEDLHDTPSQQNYHKYA